jgi:hypothetical protein
VASADQRKAARAVKRWKMYIVLSLRNTVPYALPSRKKAATDETESKYSTNMMKSL